MMIHKHMQIRLLTIFTVWIMKSFTLIFMKLFVKLQKYSKLQSILQISLKAAAPSSFPSSIKALEWANLCFSRARNTSSWSAFSHCSKLASGFSSSARFCHSSASACSWSTAVGDCLDALLTRDGELLLKK